MKRDKRPPEEPVQVADILRSELRSINFDARPSKLVDLVSVFKEFHRSNLAALCLSGGGIRSATFALGIIQAMAREGLLSRFNYLSTVSGGGYLGSWLSSWIRTEQINAFERAATDIVCRGIDRETAIKTHFNKAGSETNCYEFLKYQELKYGLNSEIKNKAESSPAAHVEVPDAGGTAHETIVRSGADPETELRVAAVAGIAAPDAADTREADPGNSVTKAATDAIDAKVHDLMFSQDVLDLETVRDYGVLRVQSKLKEGLSKDASAPNPEPRAIRHLRQYSNYMTPAVGLASADTWAFVGLYLRNLFLNLTIFIPLIAAFLLVPRLVFALVRDADWIYKNYWFVLIAFLLALGLATYSLRYIIDQLPSKNDSRADDSSVLWHAVLPLVISSVFLTTLWKHRPPAGSFIQIIGLPSAGMGDYLYFILFTVGVYATAYAIFLCVRYVRGKPSRSRLALVVVTAMSCAIGGILLLFASRILPAAITDNTPAFVTFAPPIFLLVFLIQSTLYVGLSSKMTPDADREWLARIGGWLLICTALWVGVNLLVFCGPEIGNWIYHYEWPGFNGLSEWLQSIATVLGPIVAVATGLLALIGGYSARTSATDTKVGSLKYGAVSLLIQISSVLTVGALLILVSYLTIFLMSRSAPLLSTHFTSIPGLTDWYQGGMAQLRHIDVIADAGALYLLFWILGLGVIGGTMACFLNVNTFSLHGAYRDRLVRAYLGASNSYRRANPFTGFDEKDNRQLHRLRSQRPFHILNATLNLLQGSNLAWQDRKAASFSMSPLYCGSWSLGYRPSEKFSTHFNQDGCGSMRYCNHVDTPCDRLSDCSKRKALRLGTAMAISGAAANPNMGHYSSPVVTLLMSIFNIRLGWWLGNPGKEGGGQDLWRILGSRANSKVRRFYERPGPGIAILPLLNETLGRTAEDKRYVNVTDGGHFENLAIYEMALRRCRLIVVSDAAADENFKFGEIANAIEKCRVDLGVEIVFREKFNIHSRNAAEELRCMGQRYAIADVFYPETDSRGNRLKGHLIYLRPTLSDREPIDILHYAEANSSFPHQSTGDQFFDEKQFEAYRTLGSLTLDEVLAAKDVKEILANLGSN